MCPNWIKYTLKYYSLFAFHFISVARFGGSVINSLIFLCQIAICAWCSFISFESFAVHMRLMAFLDALNFFIYFLTCALTYWLIIYDSYTNRSIQHKFWQIFIRIDKDYQNQCSFSDWHYLCALILRSAINIFLIMLAYFKENAIGPYEKIMNLIFLNIFDHRIFFYLLHMKVVAFELQKIEEKLKQNRTINFITKCQCKWFGNYYNSIYEMVDHMNNAFGWSNLAITLLNFISSVVFSNFIYSQFNHKFNKFDSGSLSHLECITQNVF